MIAEKPEHELSHFSTAAQSELFDTDSKNDPAQIQKMPGAFKPPLSPSARAVYVRTRPQRGLAGVFSISGSHLVRLVPQLESGQNCSDCLFRLALPASEGLRGSMQRRPTWISLADPETIERYRRLLERVTEEIRTTTDNQSAYRRAHLSTIDLEVSYLIQI